MRMAWSAAKPPESRACDPCRGAASQSPAGLDRGAVTRLLLIAAIAPRTGRSVRRTISGVKSVVPLRGTRKAHESTFAGCAALHPRPFDGDRYAVAKSVSWSLFWPYDHTFHPPVRAGGFVGSAFRQETCHTSGRLSLGLPLAPYYNRGSRIPLPRWWVLMAAWTEHSHSDRPEPKSISSTLLAQIRARRPEAWQRLVDLYGPVVYRWCRQLGVSKR